MLALDIESHIGPSYVADMLCNLLVASQSAHHLVESRLQPRGRAGDEDSAGAAGSRHFTVYKASW